MGLLGGAGPGLLSSEPSEVEDSRPWMSGTCCEETEKSPPWPQCMSSWL